MKRKKLFSKAKRCLGGIALSLLLGANTLNAQVTVSGDITSNTTWTKNNIYLLSGFVYVTNNATLTIEPGTVIMGEQSTKGSLIITRGAKIMAQGTKNQPIVFTSNQPAGSRSYGDWGGVLLLGKAPVNVPGGEASAEGSLDPTKGLYGGSDPADNSGIMSFVRIEYPGIAFQPNSEINGLTLGGVGSGTQLDHIQVSYSGDDAFEFFGGTVNVKHLIAKATWDDDFDTDFGYQGKLQFLVAHRDSNIADPGSGSNGFESDNDGSGSTNTPNTKPVFSNVSVFGPKITSSTSINSNYRRALHLRRSTQTSTYNSVFSGYPTGLKIEGTQTGTNVTNGDLQFKNNIIAGCATPLDSSSLSFGMNAWYNSNNNSTLANTSDMMVEDIASYASPNFLPKTGSPLLSGSDFSSANLNDPFFTQTSYRGAFGADDWTECWAKFDPQNITYNGAILYPGATADFSTSVNNYDVTISNNSTNAIHYLWDFGVASSSTDTSTAMNPTYTYSASGPYIVTLIAWNECGADTFKQTVNILVGINETGAANNAVLYPNPLNNRTTLSVNLANSSEVEVTVMDLQGKTVMNLNNNFMDAGVHEIGIDASALSSGVYFARVMTEEKATMIRMVVNK